MGTKTKLLSLTTGSPPSGPFCISPDGKDAAIVVASGGIEVWSLASGVAKLSASLTAAELALPDQTAISALACNIAAGRLAWGNEQGDVGILELSSGEARTHSVSHNSFAEWPEPLREALKDRKDTLDHRVTALRYLPQQLVAVYRQGPARIYDLAADGSASGPRYLHPNGRSDAALEIAQDRGSVPRNIVTLPSYLSADASEDGRWLAIGGTRGEVGLWNLASLTAEADARPDTAAKPATVAYADYEQIPGLDGNVGAIRWTQPPEGAARAESDVDDRWLTAANDRGKVRWWSLDGLRGVGYQSHRTWTTKDKQAVVYALAFLASPEDNPAALRLAFGGTLNAGVLRIDHKSLTVSTEPSLQIPCRIRSLATDADRRRLVIATGDVDSSKCTGESDRPSWKKGAFSWLLNLTGSAMGTAGGVAVSLPGDSHSDGQWAAVVNARGSILFTAGYDGAALVWRQAADGIGPPQTLLAAPLVADKDLAILSAALSRDDRDLVLGSLGGTVRRWRDTGSGFVEQTPLLDANDSVARDPIHALAYSPDGKRLAVGDQSGLLHVWSINPNGD